MTDNADEARGRWDALIGHVVAYSIIVAGVVTAIWLVFRNEPFREPMFAYALRLFLTLAAGMAVRVIPGLFRLQVSDRGRQITTTGAIGFAVLTFLSAPVVAPNLDPENLQRLPPEVFPCRVWSPRDYLNSRAYALTARPQSLRVEWVAWTVQRLGEIEAKNDLIDAQELRNELLKGKLDEQKRNPKPLEAGGVSPSIDDELKKRLEQRDAELKKRTQQEVAVENGEQKQETVANESRKSRPVILAETAAFRHPYESFNAIVRTIPAKDAGSVAGSHQVIAFLVHGADGRKTFTPLVTLFSPELRSRIVHVPESRRGDYLFMLISLNPKEGINVRDGDLIPLQLHVL